MALFENIEKLITEHGSAAILRERLGLAADKYAVIEKRVNELESENQGLRLQLEKSTKENEALKDRVHSLTSQDGLKDEEEKILLCLAAADGWLPSRIIAQHLSINKTKVDFYLGQFERREWVSGSHFWTGQESECHIADEGRAYLIQTGKVQ